MAVTNPTYERIVMVMDVLIICEPTFILHPRQQVTYHVAFSPTVIGEHTGRYKSYLSNFAHRKEFFTLLRSPYSVVFQNEAVGEFWYNLILKATTPLPVTLPSIHCEIGK